MNFLGIDLGTSGVKAVLIDEDQTVLATAEAPLALSRPHSGWSEQDPAAWITATEGTLDSLSRNHGLEAVSGIGLSGQMHGATLLDANDTPLRPCILWNDTRAHAEAAALDADPLWRKLSGNIVFPGFTAPKLAWVEANEPTLFAQVDAVLLPKDYLRLWLTGERVSEMSDAAGTSWLDTGARDWSDSLLEKSHLSRAQMPRLVEGSAPSGPLRPALAERWGMGRSVVVAGGGGDNAASAIGVGAVRPGEAFVSLGTSGVLFAATDGYRPAVETAVHTFCHALPGTWFQMGVILSAADSLSWLARLLGRTPADLTGSLGPVRAPGRTLFLPYLGGERTPLNSASIRGAFTGLEQVTDAEAATRAVLEGVAFALADCRDALATAGTAVNHLIAVGGGSRSTHWLGIVATALGQAIGIPEDGEVGAALGAARLGLMAATGVGAEIATPPSLTATIDPIPSLASAFQDGHARFRAARTAIGDLT